MNLWLRKCAFFRSCSRVSAMKKMFLCWKHESRFLISSNVHVWILFYEFIANKADVMNGFPKRKAQEEDIKQPQATHMKSCSSFRFLQGRNSLNCFHSSANISSRVFGNFYFWIKCGIRTTSIERCFISRLQNVDKIFALSQFRSIRVLSCDREFLLNGRKAQKLSVLSSSLFLLLKHSKLISRWPPLSLW